eukprot:TRINITY_DN10251_c0_g3_i1.p1 TRINITY_DN10251_c0_g3~~TRINITY_DN10251_c0_g3_i1.p1  ORF type:complete len:140 (+),score=14.65 TRINITY_DN10251_c0_g3_i1:105-524(+)
MASNKEEERLLLPFGSLSASTKVNSGSVVVEEIVPEIPVLQYHDAPETQQSQIVCSRRCLGLEFADPYCVGCGARMTWTNVSTGHYAAGWYCTFSTQCNSVVTGKGAYRWHCEDCQHDYCIACKGRPSPLTWLVSVIGL